MTAPTPSPVTDEMCLVAAKSDYAFDVRGDWDKASRVDRERYIERCRQSIAAALDGMVVQGWQPIESAPKDGTRLDIWMIDEDGRGWREPDAYWVDNHPADDLVSLEVTRSGWFAPNHDYDGRDGWCDTPEYVNRVSGKAVFSRPTHWMPLPTPPAAQGE